MCVRCRGPSGNERLIAIKETSSLKDLNFWISLKHSMAKRRSFLISLIPHIEEKAEFLDFPRLACFSIFERYPFAVNSDLLLKGPSFCFRYYYFHAKEQTSSISPYCVRSEFPP